MMLHKTWPCNNCSWVFERDFQYPRDIDVVLIRCDCGVTSRVPEDVLEFLKHEESLYPPEKDFSTGVEF